MDRKNVADKHRFDSEDYQVFQRFLQDACGIVLGEHKQYLVINRIKKIFLEHNIETLSELVERMQNRPRSGLKETVVDAMTTNETFWFRDNLPFDLMQSTVLPDLVKNNRADGLRIWSAACSSGQEPYSLSMTIDEFKGKDLGAFIGKGVGEQKIVATDISPSMVATAEKAEYDSLAVNRGLSEQRLDSFFDMTANNTYVVKPRIRQSVEFRCLNLLDSFAVLGKFDVVFCRNVLIYFSADLKAGIVRRLHTTMKPGAYLFLGASESISAGLEGLYRMERLDFGATVYRAL